MVADTLSGWLLDLYADHEQGVVVWVMGDDGQRHKLLHDFPVTFFAGGRPKIVQDLWFYLKEHPTQPQLAMVTKETVEGEMQEVLSVAAARPAQQLHLLLDVVETFPDLELFDTDIPLFIRYAANNDVFPFARVEVRFGKDGEVIDMTCQDSRWDLSPTLPEFRVLHMTPDTDPNHERPRHIVLRVGDEDLALPIGDERGLIATVSHLLATYDPDFVITNWGDDRIFDYLRKLALRHKLPFNPNRDATRTPAYRKAHSYRQYGRIMYRGPQTHLFGRFHIDRHNAMTYGEYGLKGAIRQSRVTCLPLQEIARKSPGAGITAMFMLTAQKRGVLYPHTKQYVESPKNLMQLDRADQGGIVMKPIIGLHSQVVQIDFSSMYPSIMALWNVSPEMVGHTGDLVKKVPDIQVEIDQSRPGIVSETLKPLLQLRLKMKSILETTDPNSVEFQALKAESTALKWLLVVCFGYQGYTRFKLGRIEAHESVTAISRWVMQRSAEIVDANGYKVLHMYVDGLWVQRKDGGPSRPEDVDSILAQITDDSGLPISIEASYKWIAFLGSRRDERDPVPNRYFGQKTDGSFKVRGISSRRHDSPPWIVNAEGRILDTLAANGSSLQELKAQVPEVIDLLATRVDEIKAGQVPVEDLIVSINLSKAPSQYKVKTAGARAGLQLQRQGKYMSPGERIRFVYSLAADKVAAWDRSPAPSIDEIDVERYIELLLRAGSELLKPFGVNEDELTKLVLHGMAAPMLPMMERKLHHLSN